MLFTSIFTINGFIRFCFGLRLLALIGKRDRAFMEFQHAAIMTGFSTWLRYTASSVSATLTQVRATRAFQYFLIHALIFLDSEWCIFA